MQSFAKCLKTLFEHLQPLCCQIFARNSNVFNLSVIQMSTRTVHQVVRLTYDIDMPGHTAMLVRVMTGVGYRWYLEYTVEEQFSDFNQSQFICTMRILPAYPGSTDPLHWSYGLGITIEMSIQDVANSMISIVRDGYAC